ncbi:hypothetical protein [Clostridium sporogenes]|uniref:hypothetical protein n=1 Tax=Clostridium sporogenes TaxID=1509 RepID=UPI00024BA9B8|nr:hypothetical protein [Clostridium sporogenes]EHN13257.1 hypothetical protein IYC_20540 [Clostridium sporogenes PA 3679]MBA4509754.1 hypothetical protein [Clostridium sporogenes]MDU4598125.1 hypothetical protein [Clostridium sporogenes]NFQ36385.1 hypothetical protein [Clostridium sporogenes]NFQ59287.1 hypothetical protein [Clostridium sporogenes]
MLQVIKKEFKKLDDLAKYINRISIFYGYLKDYKILEENDKYNLLMNFDVPEVKLNLNLAKLIRGEIDERYKSDIKMIYEIKSPESVEKEFYSIFFSDLETRIIIQGYFDFVIYDLIEINYKSLEDYFFIQLSNFEYDLLEWDTKVENVLWVKEVDYKLIYNHLVKLIFNRGYLLDYKSLEELDKAIYCKIKWLNKKEFQS